jgi:S1-C subfamily serine protease
MTRRGWLRNTSLLLLSAGESVALAGEACDLPGNEDRNAVWTSAAFSVEAARIAQTTAVTISATRTVGMMQETSEGSGVMIAPGGFVITAHHVIRDADTVELNTVEHRRLHPRPVHVDSRYDLALLKVDSSRPFAAAPLADGQSVRRGKSVLVVGAPAGVATARVLPAHVGEQRAVVWDGRRAHLRSVNVTVDEGFSGGGCYDASNGQLLGIVVAKSTRCSACGYFVPADRIAEMLSHHDTVAKA